MEELLNQLQHILNTDEGQQQLKGVMDMLGGQNGETPDLSSVFGAADQTAKQTSEPQQSASSIPPIDPTTILMVQQLMSSMNKEDDNTRLLAALKPHFKGDRQAKVDQAIHFLRLFALWPLIKDSGLLGGLFNAK